MSPWEWIDWADARRERRRNILVAGMGNVLNQDDGFGVRLIEAVEGRSFPSGVDLMEVGIGGLHLVQELMSGYDALVLVDTLERGGEPGTLYVLRPETPPPEALSEEEARAILADTHYTVPAKILILARSIGTLPRTVYLVGCQAGTVGLGLGLTDAVAAILPHACETVGRLVDDLHAGDEPEAETVPMLHSSGAR